ncbi:lysine-2,3-aminomutase-like protein [Acidisoma cellulosilytica]|uniref:Lysine-2,3-aminomutase-like protein n=1 Tax=Acidisoma cellulosilyticum TaxID=2802395 RepID=A0A964E2Q9_9PROT|nr:lysine-2,3-aminomutase-like protein [Acidisoma cellulosilyticum]MCB8879063.1 lysine-2,3-aminomutase-like protein [Acidisoma cellulosilyticum]
MGAETIRDIDGLIRAGFATEADRPALTEVGERYAITISDRFTTLIESPDDAIGRQFVPHGDERITAPHESPDPIGDDALSPLPGIVHRYADRVLLKPLLICPVYCRFCFRREHVGPDGGLLTEAQLAAAYAYIEALPDLREVILTGGDPLMLSPRRMAAIMQRLAAIPHVETIRIHSRLPLATPERLTEAMADALDVDRAVWLVVHANHAREFTQEGAAALRRVQRRGIPVLGQSVLLRGVNDTSEALEALFRAMIASRVKPYYLHQLDAAPGTARFHVPISEGQALLRSLRGRVTGLAWPTYVLDIPGGQGKVPIGPDYLLAEDQVRDPAGITHRLGAARASLPADGGAVTSPASNPDDIEKSDEAAGEPYPRRPGDRA